MIKQRRKRLATFLAGYIFGIALHMTTTAMAMTTPREVTDVSEVAEQNSVSDEQAMTLTEVDLPLNGSLISENASLEEVYYDGWLNASVVNVMKEPNIDSELLEIYKYNTLIFYTEENVAWVKIKYDEDVYGYIQTGYISEEKNEPLNPYQDLINSLTEEEKYLIYQVTYLESGNQTMDGQRACIEVILNRVLSDRYPNNVEAVLGQPGQFTVWKNRFCKSHNEEQELALQLVYDEPPVLSQDYLMFSLGKFSWGRNYVKIDDVWFGTF